MPGLWDETLYAGSAEHYLAGRMPYPAALGEALARELGLTGTERLLDLGCGPGALTLVVAPHVGEVLGVDPDPDFLAVAAGLAIPGATWRQACAEDLPPDLGPFDVVTMAQSFHWMDQPVVARLLRALLRPGGTCVHVGATTQQGREDATGTRHPLPPWEQVRALVRAWLGDEPRAGQGTVLRMQRVEAEALAAAGFVGPREVDVPCGQHVTRTEDQVVSSVFSLSSAAPHLFGGRVGAFETELRALLRTASADGVFTEVLGDMTLRLWRSPTGP